MREQMLARPTWRKRDGLRIARGDLVQERHRVKQRIGQRPMQITQVELARPHGHLPLASWGSGCARWGGRCDERVGTPTAASRVAYASPSSRSGSYSAVITVAGGSPVRSAARSGDASGFAPCSADSRYIPQYHCTAVTLNRYGSVPARMDGLSAWYSVFG